MALLAACDAASPPPGGSPPGTAGSSLIAIEGAACASPVPATFAGRFAEQGYVAYRTCRGAVRNDGTDTVDADIWVDALDAAGRPGGACRVTAGTLGPGARREWEATCPVTRAEVGFAVRVTDAAGSPLPTRRP
ncbi:MAG TPA: FxLYD domain-containing protein [Candidatus Limnocylindria bacterium]|nr:FxLYD domain-containing protein [Candidatus Limnocylindria bacterium]